MRHKVGILLVLLAALLIVLPAAAQGDENPIQVGVVIQGAEGVPQTYCVTLDSEHRTGLDALNATGQAVLVETSSNGTTVCRIGENGCAFPDEHCFCQCEGGSSCAYWSYFHRGEGESWQYSPVGAHVVTLEQGAVEGWWWRDSANADAPKLASIAFEAICPQQPAFPRTVIDGMGREVMIEAPPQRIASVTLGSDEILLDMVGPERLLGVTYFAPDPSISNITDRLGDISYIDLSGSPEYLISLDADLVILAAYNNPAAVDQLLDAGVPVFVLTEFNTLDEIRANIRLLGQVTGEEQTAELMIADLDGRLAAVREKVAGQTPVRVLYYEPGGITYGPGSTVDEIITLAGGINVVSDADLGPYPLIDDEFILAADPDVILLGGWYNKASLPIMAFAGNEALMTLRAVQEGRIYVIQDAHMTNVSQYVALGVEDVARALYPAVFEENDGTN